MKQVGAKLSGSAPPVWNIGVNVPWVIAWSEENQFRMAPSESFPGRVEIIQKNRPGRGTPQFSGMHVMRQRAGVVGKLCHVCGRPTPPEDRYLFPVPTGVFVTAADGSSRYASHLPPVHLGCAGRAQELCPHLNFTRSQPVLFPAEATEIQCETNAPPGMHELAAALAPGVKPIFSYFRVYGPGFSRLVSDLRAEAKPEGLEAANQP